MRPDHSKYFFNAAIFLFAGLISILRHESLEAIIAFTFCGIFFLLSIILKEKSSSLLRGKLGV